MDISSFSPERSRRDERLAAWTVIGAAVASVVVFMPPEGRVLTPVHDAVVTLLGAASFLLPIGLLLLGVLFAVRERRPGLKLPARRLVGLVLLALALLPAERLLGDTTGVIGEWLATLLLDLLGGPIAVVLLLLLVVVGAGLAFGVTWKRQRHAAR